MSATSDDMAARHGQKTADLLRTIIADQLKLVPEHHVHWWGGFLARLAALCRDDVGQEARDILIATTAKAVENTTGRRTQ